MLSPLRALAERLITRPGVLDLEFKPDPCEVARPLRASDGDVEGGIGIIAGSASKFTLEDRREETGLVLESIDASGMTGLETRSDWGES